MNTTTLARLHAAIDLVSEVEEQLDSIPDGSPTLSRARFLANETRQLLGALLNARASGSSGGAVRPLAAAHRAK